MDYMLYIIAGLVIIVVIAVLVLRKNKAQQSPAQPRQADSNIKNDVPAAATDIETSVTTNSVEDNNTKFLDNLAAAQGFIDQQRYDKALEILKRGLIQKPHDNQLSIKLLNVYALTNQKEDFDNTYTDIQAYGDTATIGHAQKLKSLMDAEQAHISSASPKDNDEPSAFESLDFDIATEQTSTSTSTSNNNTKVDTQTSEESNHKELSAINANLNKDNINMDDGINVDPTTNSNDDAFDLILSDLETADLEQDALENIPTDPLEDGASRDTEVPISTALQLDSDTPVTDNDTITSSADSNSDNSSSDNIDDDFTLDFDLDSDDTPVDSAADNNANEHNFSDDDFVLDFDDLAEDTDSDIGSDIDSNAAVVPTSPESTDDEFTLSVDETDLDIDDANTNAPTTQDASLEESNVEGTTAQLNALHFDEELSDSAVSPIPVTAAPTFDDNTPYDDTVINDLDFDSDTIDASPTTLTPVVPEDDSVSLDHQDKDTLPSADFAAQFAADFDFVKTLDNNQVTLDLANQYLHLGEYDSAKRLLNEVMTQGNSEQQQQAQELLARTV